MNYFDEVKADVEEVLRPLRCTKCMNLSEKDIWMLNLCKHKYCSDCFPLLSKFNEGDDGNMVQCADPQCSAFSFEEESKPDPFSSSLLSTIKSLLIRNENEGFTSRSKSASKIDNSEVNELLLLGFNEMKTKFEAGEEDVPPVLKIMGPSSEDEEDIFKNCDPSFSCSPPKLSIFSPNAMKENSGTPLSTLGKRKKVNSRIELRMETDSSDSAKKLNEDKTNVDEEKSNVKTPESSSSSSSSSGGISKSAKTPKVSSKNSRKSLPILSTENKVIKETKDKLRKSLGVTASISSPIRVSKKNVKGETPLHKAAHAAQVQKVKELIELGADVNARDFANWSPLHEAINNGKDGLSCILEVMKLLCEKGANVNAFGSENETPLHQAASRGDVEIINLLLSYGANKDLLNAKGQLPAQVAKSSEIMEIINNYDGPYVTPEIGHRVNFSEDISLLYYAFESKDPELIHMKDKFNQKFGIKPTFKLSPEISHIVFEPKPNESVQLSLNYLAGTLIGATLLSSNWMEESLEQNQVLNPQLYKIKEEEAHQLSQANRAQNNPGLFDGLTFYFVKDSSYKNVSNGLSLSKKDIGSLIELGGGKLFKRAQPNPEVIDPLEAPLRFHVSSEGHPLTITTHLGLYSKDFEPPTKLNLEHIKTVDISYVVHCIQEFKLLDTTQFL